MATVVEKLRPVGEAVRERITEAARYAEQVSGQRRILKDKAVEAVDAGAETMRRLATRARAELLDAKKQTRSRIRREPGKAVTVAFGGGLVAGVALFGLAWLVARARRTEHV